MALTPAGENAKQQIIALANLLRTDDRIDEDSPLRFYPEVVYARTQRLTKRIDACADAIVAGLIEALAEKQEEEKQEEQQREQQREQEEKQQGTG